MKWFTSFLLLSLVFFSSCEELEGISTVDLETTLNKDISVIITDQGPATVNESFTTSALSDNEIARYKENIQEFKVTRVAYKIKQFSGASGITMTGTLKLGPVDANIESIDLEDLSNTGAEQDLDLFDSELQQLANELDLKDEVSGSIEGTVSDKPVQFTFMIIMDVEFRAKVL